MKKALFIVLSLFLFTASASATIAAEAAVGGGSMAQANANVPGVINRYITFAFSIGALLAFGMIVYGGFRYIVAAGNTATQSDARDQIFQAIIGLLLLVGSVLILRTIDRPLAENMQIRGTTPLAQPGDPLPMNPPSAVCSPIATGLCQSQGLICRMAGTSPVCTAEACGAPGSTSNSACPTGCTCFHDRNIGRYQCVNINTTDPCGSSAGGP